MYQIYHFLFFIFTIHEAQFKIPIVKVFYFYFYFLSLFNKVLTFHSHTLFDGSYACKNKSMACYLPLYFFFIFN